MQNENYCIDGEWPPFQSRFDMHVWVSRQLDIKAGRFSPHDPTETCPSEEMTLRESLQAVLT